MWNVTGNIFYNINNYSSQKSGTSTRRLKEEEEHKNQRIDDLNNLSTYDLKLIFQLLIPRGHKY